MSGTSQSAELRAAMAAANAAAESLMAKFSRADGETLKAWQKYPGALVTEADIAADKAIAQSLGDSGIEASLISEESRSGDESSELTWLIDPLCGTVPFRSGMPHWGVNIGLRRDDRLVAGVIALPTLDRVLAATSGGGVTLNGEPFAGRDPELPLNEAVVGLEIDAGMWSQMLVPGRGGVARLNWAGSISHTNTFASAAYPIGLVCVGGMSGVVFYPQIDSVHLAAGAAIAQELGVIVSDDRGNPLDWASTEPYDAVVVAWPSAHEALIEAMGG